jgi:nitric oxide reductase NorD protein
MADRLLSDAGARECAWLYRDTWTGELHDPNPLPSSQAQGDAAGHESQAQKSARLPRRPQVRQQDTRDEARGPGAWLIQTSEPLEKAEDPLGLQRPADRDDSVAADEYADAVAELLEARLVSTSGTPKEVLLSEDPPPKQGRWMTPEALSAGALQYPEWDYRRAAYRMPGATVHELSCRIGSLNWVTAILAKHQALLHTVQRQFESLRVERLRLHQQRDGEELDLNACIDARAELKAGAELPAGLYETYRPARRDLAVLLLVDVSGSTDAWIAQQRRVIDVEREALLLVAVALEALHERYSILGFSGEGPNAVTVRTLKQFEEPYGQHVALRIAGLEPERFTRAGAALRHASALLRRQPVRHRLLLMLSDGRPNDMDEYDGQYGVDDLRQAVAEARTSDINVFCLTVDRQLPDYLRTVFGASGYAVLQTPELLGTALLRWLQRLIRH